MTNRASPSTDDVTSAGLQKAMPQIASRRWTKVLGQAVTIGVFVVFAMYVANLIVLPLLTNGRIEDFIDSPYRALQKLLVAFAVGIAIAVFRARGSYETCSREVTRLGWSKEES